MTIKFNKTDNFKAAKQELTNVLAKGGNAEEQAQAFENFLNTLQSEITKSVTADVNNNMLDRSILQQRGQNVLTSEEMKFFNAVVEEGGFTDDSILPVTTQERVFEDLVKEYPLLDAIGLQDLGRSEEHTSELQSRGHLVCRLL